MEANPIIAKLRRRKLQRESLNGDNEHAKIVPFPSGEACAPAKPRIGADDVAGIRDLIRAGAEIKHLWRGWIQIGVLTLIAAQGGVGKTRFCADLLRRMRKGLPWPDGQKMEQDPNAVALWVMSDNHHDEMVTLTQSFGIVDGVKLNAPKHDAFIGGLLETPRDLVELEERIEAVKPVMVIIDTVGNSTEKNLSLQEDAKAYYQPLQLIARRQKTAIICQTHLAASGHALGRRAREKVRVEIHISRPNPEDPRRRIWVEKSNSEIPQPLGMKMGSSGNDYDLSPPALLDDDGNERETPSGRHGRCVSWLVERLACGPRRLPELRSEAKDAGYSPMTLYAAAKCLNIDAKKDGRNVVWELREQHEDD